MGDVGYLDDAGYLFLTDRKAFTIISGGVNVYPQEAENVLAMHPDVADVAVFGIPHSDLGEVPHAVIQLVPSAIAREQLSTALLSYCREQLATIKCPRTLEFIEEMPRLPTGKLYKQRFKDRHWPPSS
jgi:acyl-CoA synthetase (AMP-forming)/AMP-acid ligase II